jgi:CBS domain-containing protein
VISKLAKLKVSEVMTKSPITVEKTTSLSDVKNIFESRRIHHIPVLGDGAKVVGMISKSDLLMLYDWDTRGSGKVEFSKREAFSLCTKKVFVVRESDFILECYQLFKSNSIKSLPVIDHHERLTGIITSMDLLNAAYSELCHDFELMSQSKP